MNTRIDILSRFLNFHVANPLYTGMSDCIKKTIKWEGVSGLYKGFISPLWGSGGVPV